MKIASTVGPYCRDGIWYTRFQVEPELEYEALNCYGNPCFHCTEHFVVARLSRQWPTHVMVWPCDNQGRTSTDLPVIDDIANAQSLEQVLDILGFDVPVRNKKADWFEDNLFSGDQVVPQPIRKERHLAWWRRPWRWVYTRWHVRKYGATPY